MQELSEVSTSLGQKRNPGPGLHYRHADAIPGRDVRLTQLLNGATGIIAARGHGLRVSSHRVVFIIITRTSKSARGSPCTICTPLLARDAMWPKNSCKERKLG